MMSRSNTTSAAPYKTLPCGRPMPEVREKKEDARALFQKVRARLEAYAAEKKINRSEAREKILETIVSEARHFTALDLLGRLSKRHPEVGKATLYRNLPVLVASGIIQEGPTDPSGQVLYELSEENHHDHIVCLDCHRIFEFHDETIEKRQSLVSSRLDFTPQSHRHVIYASCSFCGPSGKEKVK